MIRLSAAHSGGNVLVKLQDDGAGAPTAPKIIERPNGWGSFSTKNECATRICSSSFSGRLFDRRESVTELSGRGVDTSTVRHNIDALRGTVEITSEEAKGTTITLRLPLTLTIIEGFSVKVAGLKRSLIPLEYVTECTEMAAEQRKSEASGILNLRGKALPYLRLRDLFHIPGDTPKKTLLS